MCAAPKLRTVRPLQVNGNRKGPKVTKAEETASNKQFCIHLRCSFSKAPTPSVLFGEDLACNGPLGT